MKKQIKYLIGGAVVLVLLIVTLIFVTKWIGPQETESSSSSANSALFGDSLYLNDGKKVDDIAKVSFKNTRGSYEVNRLDDTNFIIDELKDTPYDTTKMNNMGNFAAAFYASDTASESEDVDLSLYGLNEPRAQITAHYNDGSEFTILLGNDAPANRGVYGKLPDSNNVYIFNHADVDPFMLDFTYLMSTEIAPDYEGYAYGYFRQMTVSGTAIETDKPIKVEPNEELLSKDEAQMVGSLIMTSHNDTFVSSDYLADMLNTVFPTNAEEVIAVNPSDDELAEYGLNNPSVKLDIDYIDDNGNELSLVMAGGKTENGYIYTTNEKGNVIYKVKAPTEDRSWTTVTYLKLQNKLFLFPAIKDISSVELTSGGKEYKFDIIPHETTDKEGNPAIEYTYEHNGTELNSDLFVKFYQVVIGIRKEKLTSLESGSPSSSPEVKIVYNYVDSSTPSDTVEFYLSQDNNRYYHVSVNGNIEFDTLSTYIKKLNSDITKLFNGEDINTDF